MLVLDVLIKWFIFTLYFAIIVSTIVDEDVLENMKKDNNLKELIENIDVLVDGKFELDKKDDSLKFRGSSNQRLIDVKRSLEQNKVVVLNY